MSATPLAEPAGDAAPRVSLIIPAYNSAATLTRAINSVARQTFSDWELIVVDDGSTDDTPRVLEDCARTVGPRMTRVRTENQGAGAARNLGIELARGCYIAFLDADDELLPRRFARQAALLDALPDVGLVFSDYAYRDRNGELHASVFDDLAPEVREVPSEAIANDVRVCGPELCERMTSRYLVSTITGMVRRELLGEDIRFPNNLCYCEEWVFFLSVCRRTRGAYIDAPLALHHHTDGSLSRTSVRRNLEHRIRALDWIRRTAEAPSARALRELRGQIVEAHRQLAFDHYKSGAFAAAAGHFARALRLEPGIRPAVHLLQALVRIANPPQSAARG